MWSSRCAGAWMRQRMLTPLRRHVCHLPTAQHTVAATPSRQQLSLHPPLSTGGAIHSSGSLAFTVSNSEMPVEQADPAAKKRKTDETKVSCHEAAQLRTKTECVECPKCAVWFHSNCIVRKFNDDPEKIRADPKWTCWHCRGVCGHHSCVTMREDGKRAGEVELHVDEGKKYYSLIMEATTAGHKSVQDHLKATGRDAW